MIILFEFLAVNTENSSKANLDGLIDFFFFQI